MAIVNLGNDKLNINTTTAKGLEKVVGYIAKFIISAQTQTNIILFGRGGDNPKTKGIQKVFQAGVVNVVEDLADVDFCNLLNYLASQGRLGGSSFNPTGPPENASQFEKKKWRVQKFAFDIQKNIDKYYATYGGFTGQDSRRGLLETINAVNLSMESLLSPTIGLNDPEILKEFPEVATATNYLSNALAKFNNYTNVGNISIEEVEKAVQFIEKVRFFCGAILSLNNPANLISAANLGVGGKIQDDFKKVNKYITPGPKTIILLKTIITEATKINSIAKKILGYINLVRTIIKLALLLVKIFNILRAGIFAIAQILPSLFSSEGIGLSFNTIYQEKLNELGVKKLIKRLQQINLVLNITAIFVTTLVAALTSIIRSLTAILLNIQSCYPDLGNDLKNLLDDLAATKDGLSKFLDDYNTNKNKIDKTFGGYTIEIVTEELTDEGINLKRRYGIARSAQNNIVVQSTPTFASLDLIIINEVKVRLVSQGYVKIGLSTLDSQSAQIILESLNYLEDPDITLSNIDLQPTDVANLIEAIDSPETSNSDITTFTNNLSGGKALRNKVRKKLGIQKLKLGSELNSADPNSKFGSNITKG